MKILIIGGDGTIGTAARKELSTDCEVVSASRTGTDYKVDITSPNSIDDLFKTVGTVDAIICTAGSAHFATVDQLSVEENMVAVNSKLLGQVNLVLKGMQYVRDNGSITLTTGVLMDDPLKTASSSALANGGVAAFVKTAAIEMPRGIRINHVSPSMLEESKEKYGNLFQGFKPVSSERVGLAFRKSVFGAQTGQAYKIY